MSVITKVPEPNLWDEICKEFNKQRPPFEDDIESISTVPEDYDAAKHNPVFFSDRGELSARVAANDINVYEDFDSSKYHPSIIGYSFVKKPEPEPPQPPPTPPNKKTCSPTEYLNHYVFPVLLPALEEMLACTKSEKCFERKNSSFNAGDYLTEYLYNNNPNKGNRENKKLGDIPFVKEHWKEYPRPPLPKSLIWTDTEAIAIIQAFWRGFKVRCEPEVGELRQWQKEWRKDNSNIKEVVDDFWSRQMPENVSNYAANIVLDEEDRNVFQGEINVGYGFPTCSDRPVSKNVTIRSPEPQ